MSDDKAQVLQCPFSMESQKTKQNQSTEINHFPSTLKYDECV